MTLGTIRAVDPIPRIEGHLGVKLTLNDDHNRVVGADVHGNMFRGFENFLIGRDPNDAITFTQRICGVCPVPHGTTATFAVEAAYGYSDGHITFSGLDAAAQGVPVKALHIRNLILGAEFLMSSITHFYHLTAQSYIQGPNMPPWTPYFHDDYYNPLLLSKGAALPGQPGPTLLWSAVITQYVKALRMRRLTFEAGALFAGRMPMTSALVAGGVTTQSTGTDFVDRCKKFYDLLHEVGLFIVREYVPLALALGALYPEYDNKFNHSVGKDSPLDTDDQLPVRWGIGAGLGNFLSWGGFPQADDTLAIKGGFKLKAAPNPTVLVDRKTHVSTGVQNMIDQVNRNLTEDTARSWYVNDSKWGYAGGATSAKPGDVTRTQPNRDKSVEGNRYSWMKAPRWNGNAMEVGPLARMVVQGWYPVDGSLLAGAATQAHPGFNPGGGYFGYSSYIQNLHVVDAGLTGALGGLLETVVNWIANLRGGLSVMDRLRARALESLVLVQLILGAYNPPLANSSERGTFGGDLDQVTGIRTGGWINAAALVANGKSYKSKSAPIGVSKGYGAMEAPRGSLSHHVSQIGGRITAYQCVVPTTWNASPKDGVGVERNGAMEQAMIGAPYAGRSTPGVEAMRIAQSFDPCIACAVH